MGGGQDKPAWTACLSGVKITRAGGKISGDSLPPGGQANHGRLAPRGASCPGGKINWDTSKDLKSAWESTSLCAVWIAIAKDLKLLQADSKESDQTGHILRLI